MLLFFHTRTKANFTFQTIRPEMVGRFTQSARQQSVALLVHNSRTSSDIGGFGLRSTVRNKPAAHWFSTADCISTLRRRPSSLAVHTCLRKVMVAPSWLNAPSRMATLNSPELEGDVVASSLRGQPSVDALPKETRVRSPHQCSELGNSL